jgi:carbamoyltransferase
LNPVNIPAAKMTRTGSTEGRPPAYNLENILAVNLNHDGSGVILSGGRIKGYVNTERFSRLKKHPGLREDDLTELLDQSHLTLEDIDLVLMVNLGVNYPEIEAKYGSDLKETWFDFSFNESRDEIMIRGRAIPCIINPNHFLCHSACAYYFSPFPTAVCLAFDPMGSGAFLGLRNRLREIPFPSTHVGNVYDSISSKYLGFGGVFGAGKTMGLAPYGGNGDEDARMRLRALAERPCTLESMSRALALISELSEGAPVMIEADGRRWNAALAYHVQAFLEEHLVGYLNGLYDFSRAKYGTSDSEDPSLNLCLSGGTALNSVANQIAFSRSPFKELYLHPACGDDGTAIGAALFFWHHVFNNPKIPRTNREAMFSIRSYDLEIPAALEKYRDRIRADQTADYLLRTAKLLADGKIVGWYRGASEIGPRALGNRSILCDPRNPDMKRILNSRVKFRESFRPFAPTILEGHSEDWFGLKFSPFMLRVAKVKKSGAGAIVHVDHTARPQVLEKKDNPEYYELIEAFFRLTGVPLLLNTSFNIRGEPIVETPMDALECFLRTGLDHLVFPGVIVSKPGD